MSAFFILGTASAFAAMPGVGSSFTGADVTVATGASADIPVFTITDANVAQITDANEIRIVLNNGYNAHWNTADNAAVIGGAAAAKLNGTVSYAGANNEIAVISVIADFTNNEVVTITGLEIIGDASLVGTVMAWSVDGGVTYSNVAGPPQLTVTATDAEGTVSLSNFAVGATQNTTISFTLTRTMLVNDTVTFTLPAEIDVSAFTPRAATGSLVGGGTVDCTNAGQNITCTINGASSAGPGVRTIILTGFTGKFVGTTDVSNLAVNSSLAGGGDINFDASLPTDDVLIGAFSLSSVTASSLTASTSSDYTINFTTVGTTMDNGAKLVVTFPGGYSFGSMTATGQNLVGLDGTWNAVAVGQVVTLTQAGGGTTAPGAKTLKIANVTNTSTTGATGNFVVKTTTGSPANIQTLSPAGVTIAGGSSYSSSLGAISNIAVNDESTGGVRITWTAPGSSDTFTYVQILKGTAPGPVDGTAYTNVAKGTNYYVDTNVSTGDVVSYQLRGTDWVEVGILSSAVTFTVGSTVSTTTATTGETTGTTTDATTTATDTSTSDSTTTATTTTTSSFTDSSEIPSWAQAAITALANAGVVAGNPDGSFAPNNNLNRAEAATMLWRVLAMGDPTGADAAPFTDVALNQWYTDYVASLKGLDLVSGNPDGTYQPSENINRAEFLMLAMNVYVYLNPSADVGATAMTDAYWDLDSYAWYSQTVSAATDWGFVQGSACNGYTCFNAGSAITRAEASQILYKMFRSTL